MVLLLFCSTAYAEQQVRIATWNVLDVGEPGSQEYEAAFKVLTRLDADVVAVQEVASATDATYIVNLAVDLGYPNVTVAPGGPFGSDRTAIMSDFAMQPGVSWTSAALSGDPAANDITRYILEAEVDVSGGGDWLSVIVNHWKSGTTNTDEYRRAIESTRISQVVHNIEDEDQPYIILGDVNQDIRDGALTPNYFTSIPADLPAAFVTGSDIQDLLTSSGLLNDPFSPVTSLASMLDAKQVDGNYATRPESGRRLDYVFANERITEQGAQVYDCADEGIPGSLPLAGEPLPATTCPLASDHLPVFADLDVATINVTTGECLLNWAERSYPTIFSPSGATTQFSTPYDYRYYSGTNIYLGVSRADNHVYYLDSGGLHDVGLISGWLPQANCEPKPTQCLFDWAEQQFPNLFPPSQGIDNVSFTYAYRYYPGTSTYLSLHSDDNQIRYMLADGIMREAGPYDYWMTQAGCTQ